jgi:hypothetical protein
LSEFSLGFAKGLPKGVYESGEGILLFLADFVSHPIQTSTQIVEALSTLTELAGENEWELICEPLAPEISQLVKDWDTLPSELRGELAGYAVGKHGGDILAPGALAKVAGKSINSAKELAAICKNIKLANETLVLETAAGLGNSAKIEEIISSARKTKFLGDELGFTAKEMAELKQAGRLETTLEQRLNHLSLPKQESIQLFKEAEEFLRGFKGFRPEQEVRNLIHKTGLPTFPRPKGIPENFRVKLSNKGAGMKYVHPNNEGTYVRVMPGKPHSPLPYQQKPYVTQMKNGKALDNFGNEVASNTPEAHIPIKEFVLRIK